MKTLSLLLLSVFFISNSATATTTPKPVVSSWQSIATWQRQAAGNTVLFSGVLPQAGLHQKGITLVFVKGYNCSTLPMSEKPLALPFLFLGDDQMAYQWKLNNSGGQMVLETEMSATCEAAYLAKQTGVLYRQFYFDEQFLKEKSLTPQAVKKLGYNQVLALAGVAE